ncbi:MAG: PIN domain-containing protein [Candidatus Saccharimonadales bacterium]
MKSLDTSVILRFLLNDHPAQSPAVNKLIASSPPNSFYVSDVAIVEAVWVMQGHNYIIPRSFIAEALAKLTETPQIKCNRDLIYSIIPIYLSLPSSVSFTDIALAAYAKLTNNKPLLTFDKQLARKLPKLVEAI